MGTARQFLAWVPLLSLAACSSPSYVDEAKQSGSADALMNEVVFKVHGGFDSPKPDCVAILPFAAKDGIAAKDAESIRSAIYQHLAPRVREVPLADVDRLSADPESLHCAAVIDGKITHYGTTFLGIVSQVDVGAELTMRRVSDGTVIWEGKHIASSIDGGVPIDPLSAAAGVIVALTNIRGEQTARLTDDLARRLVSTIPPMTLPSLADPGEPPASKVASAAIWFSRGRTALALQDFPRAHEDFIKAIALDDGNATYRDGLAIACAQSGQVENALAAYSMAIALNPDDGFAWYNTGILQFNAGHKDEAVAAFRKAGSAYLAKGDTERAGQAADRLKEIAAVTHSGDRI
ncbi:MAG TPA: tetratricopeptide repeat protein [Magnetospirillaceae bacterium]|jgi:hypothetical protein